MRKYGRKTSTTMINTFYKQHWTACNIIDKAEKDFYKRSLHDNKTTFKAIFNTCNNLLGRNLGLPLSPSINNKMLAEEFNTFFTNKIAKIRENLQHRRKGCSQVQSATYISETCNLWSDQLMKNFTQVGHKMSSNTSGNHHQRAVNLTPSQQRSSKI